MNTDTLSSPHTAKPATKAARPDIYVHIHKALRHFMLDTLCRVGRMDVTHAEETDGTLAQFDALMALCTNHLKHENEFIHPAIEAGRRGVSDRIAGEHVEHLESIDALREDARQLRAARGDGRAPLALRLYRHMALFVADNFEHMHYEETVHNAALWSLYSDAEIDGLHNRLVASIPPQEMFEVARWMLPAMNPAERAGMLGGIKAVAPPAVFAALLSHVRPHLDDKGWTKLASALGVSA